MQPEDRIRLKHIIEEAKEACLYVQGLSFEDFLHDGKTVRAVIRSIEIIGEAASKISMKLREDYPDIPWKKIIGMRNRLIHVYFDIDHSSRKNGNTSTLLQEVLRPIEQAGWDTALIQVGGQEVRGCIACYKCFENKDQRCSVDTDMFNQVLEKMIKADALILGSPTYFTDVSAELKAVLDRSGLVSQANNVLFQGKIGAAVIAVRRGGAIHAYDSINHMFLMSQMIIPGSTYWNIGLGFEPAEVLQDKEGMLNMRHLGAVIAWLGGAIYNHLDSYPRPS